MQAYSRLIGIDVGTKKVGIAQTDLLKTIATPVGTYPPDEVIGKLSEIAQQHKIERFVVGWPLSPRGGEGAATKMVQDFIEKLQKRFPDIPVTKIDEQFTSKKALQYMIEAGVPQKKRRDKTRVDKIAAAIILQQYLDLND